MKLDRHPQAAANLAGIAADQAADHLIALVEADDDRCVGDTKGWRLWPPDDGPAVNLAGAGAAFPSQIRAPAEAADRGRVEDRLPAFLAALKEELSPPARVPERLRKVIWLGQGNPFRLRHKRGHEPQISRSRGDRSR
jgi:hypothetical protein